MTKKWREREREGERENVDMRVKRKEQVSVFWGILAWLLVITAAASQTSQWRVALNTGRQTLSRESSATAELIAAANAAGGGRGSNAPLKRRSRWKERLSLFLSGLLVFSGILWLVWKQLRRRTAALRASEERFRLAFMTNPDAVTLSYLKDGRYVDINEGFTAITGYTREEVIGKTTADLSIWGNPEDRLRLLDGIKKNGKVTNQESLFRLKNGKILTGLISASVIELNGVPHLLAITRDIENLKQAERTQEKSLRELRQLYKLSVRIRGSYSPVLVAQAALNAITEAIEPDISFFFIRREERLELLKSHTGATSFALDQAEGHRLGECLCGLVAQQKKPIFSRDIKTDFRCTRDECKAAGICSFAGLPLLAGEEVLGMIALGTITERDFEQERIFLETLVNETAVGFQNAKILERLRNHESELTKRVRARTEELEIANRELESFSYSVSHDLRAPLRAIDGFSKIIEDEYGGRLDAEAQRLIQIVRNNTQRMGLLIDDLLSFSRVSRHQLALIRVDMAGMARAIYYELTNEEQRAKIHFHIQDGLPPAQADSSLMRQVWSNLIGNAIKFSAPAEISEIEVGFGVENGKNTYFIRDNGVGFDPQYTETLFQVFQRLHSEDEFPGTGIGLSIVERIINRHKGRIWAESEKGKGAIFYFTLSSAEKDR